MALSPDIALMLVADFSFIRQVSTNIDDARAAVYIQEAQKGQLRDFLGDPLYFQLIDNYQIPPDDDFDKNGAETRLANLWFGTNYTVQGEEINFPGLKWSLIYWTYARFVVNQDFNVTRYGNVKTLDDDLSEHETVQQQRTKRNEANDFAQRYQRDAERFLNENTTIYPEWRRISSQRHKSRFGYPLRKIQKPSMVGPVQSFNNWPIWEHAS